MKTYNASKHTKTQYELTKTVCLCLFVWGLTALSAQTGYIAP